MTIRFFTSLFLMLLLCGCGQERDRAAVKTGRATDFAVSHSTDGAERAQRDVTRGSARALWRFQVPLDHFDTLNEEAQVEWFNRLNRQETYDWPGREGGVVDINRARRVLELVAGYGDGIRADIQGRLRDYLAQYLILGGPVDCRTGQRNQPRFIPGELARGMEVGLANGAPFDFSGLANLSIEAPVMAQLEALFEEVRRIIFDADRFQGRERKESGTDSTDPSDTESTDTGIDALPAAPNLCAGRRGDLLLFFDDHQFDAAYHRLAQVGAQLDGLIRQQGGQKSARPFAVPPPPVHGQLFYGTRDGRLGLTLADGLGMALSSHSDDGTLVFWANVAGGLTTLRDRVAHVFTPSSVAQRRSRLRDRISSLYVLLSHFFGSGTDGTERQASDWLASRLGPANPTITALRRDLAVLFVLFQDLARDPLLVASDEVRNTFIDEYLYGTLEMVAAGVPVDDPQLAARIVVFNALLSSDLLRAPTGHKPAALVPNYPALADGIRRLLVRVRKIRFFGDGQAAAELLNQFGRPRPAWNSGLEKRFGRLSVKRQLVPVYPSLIRQARKGLAIEVVTGQDPVAQRTRALFGHR